MPPGVWLVCAGRRAPRADVGADILDCGWDAHGLQGSDGAIPWQVATMQASVVFPSVVGMLSVYSSEIGHVVESVGSYPLGRVPLHVNVFTVSVGVPPPSGVNSSTHLMMYFVPLPILGIENLKRYFDS